MKKIIAGLMVAAAMLSFGCGGRNSEFGVVDMRKVEKEATVLKTVQTDLEKQIAELREKAIKDSEGKTDEEKRKIAEDFQAKAKLAQSEAQNKVKTSVDTAMNAVAKEKGLGAILLKDAVPQGGKDVTADVIAKMGK